MPSVFPTSFYKNNTTFTDLDRPILTIVVDTEEEFNWSTPFSRSNRSVTNAIEQAKAHEIYDTMLVKPTYVIDQAILEDDQAVEFFTDLEKTDRADLGVHLHPWLTKPYDEPLNNFNSYHGNLTRELERAKIETITETFLQRIGRPPKIFKAGRYGLGRNTYEILQEFGYEIDCSVIPNENAQYVEGPDFSDMPSSPFWANEEHTFLSLPLTRGFFGWGAQIGPLMPKIFDHLLSKKFMIPGILARLGMVERSTLTPEGISAAEQIKLLDKLHENGQCFFSLTYHSSTLGITDSPYVKNERELEAFLENIHTVLNYFKQELKGDILSVPEAYKRAIDIQS